MKLEIEQTVVDDGVVLADSEVKVLGHSSTHAWQLDALKVFKGKRWSALISPCGSGKSMAQVGSAVQDVELESDHKRLQLFVVPQSHIADGFFPSNGTPITLEIDGNQYKAGVKPQQHFCDNPSLAKLRSFLLSPRKKDSLYALTSYHALVLVWKSLNDAEKKKAINNLHLRIDESHHIAAREDYNLIGSICMFMMQSGCKTCRITLSTATDFRGDKRDIFIPLLRDKFTFYKRDWLDHWKTTGIKSLKIEITEMDDPIKRLVQNICAEKGLHHLVAIPPCNAGWRLNYEDDTHGLDALTDALKKKWPKCRILDLVTQSTQEENKALLLEEPKKVGDSKFDVVITCMLGREGTDWCPCSRLHVTYVEGSLTLAVQTFNRPLRRYTSKNNVTVRYYYPYTASDFKILDDRKNAILLMTQCEEMFYPITFPMLPKDNDIFVGQGGSHNHMGSLENILGSKEYINLKKEFLGIVLENGIMGMKNASNLNLIIDTLLEDYDVPEEYKEQGRATLQIIFGRCTKKGFRDISVSFVRENGFDQLYQSAQDSDSLYFEYDLKKMKKLRSIVCNNWGAMMEKAKKNIKAVGDWDKHPDIAKWFDSHAATWSKEEHTCS